jgi:hypothetical protein
MPTMIKRADSLFAYALLGIAASVVFFGCTDGGKAGDVSGAGGNAGTEAGAVPVGAGGAGGAAGAAAGGAGGAAGAAGAAGAGGSAGTGVDGGNVADPTFAIVMDQHLVGPDAYREEFHTETTYVLAATWLDTVGPGVPKDLWKSRGGLLGLKTGDALPFVPATFNGSLEAWLAGDHQQAVGSAVDPTAVSATAMPSARLRRTAAGAEIEFTLTDWMVPIPPAQQDVIGLCGAQMFDPRPYVFALTATELQSFADVQKTLSLTMALGVNQCTGTATAVLTATLPSKG